LDRLGEKEIVNWDILSLFPPKIFRALCAANNGNANLTHVDLSHSLVPVIRPQDLAKPGQGRIQLLNTKTDPLRITGIDTKFTTELQPKFTIVLPKNVAQMEVVQVLSDTEILIKKEVKEVKALALLTSPEGSAYKCIPHVEQDSVYKVVHDSLNNNQCITIFPEGGSHDRAEMLPLKGKTVLFIKTS
jgi:glycerol-3-phosphate O-acyltransferase/dihydroxyacetone phosphate acyltransferase